MTILPVSFQYGFYVCHHVLVLLILFGEGGGELDITRFVLGGEGA